ncbi:hypothetical protein E2C01_090807 [Portunus trituberculatus]|uniref:Uncharacterized protein n=1 Tax=Portunus trituberculatus TaxID=210409 RepID=A0A5B7JLB5_PORTR|nr:hypothetical protein [Portunus trituberculatus]
MNLSSAYPSKIAQSATFCTIWQHCAQGSVDLHFRLAGWGRIWGGWRARYECQIGESVGQTLRIGY